MENHSQFFYIKFIKNSTSITSIIVAVDADGVDAGAVDAGVVGAGAVDADAVDAGAIYIGSFLK
ncbi:MAG: hypothetical protein GY853_15490 [PVC group bacterium]|nr:hypothetical protein [PVC group bacterium]